jgi:hypothetical protein
MGLRGGIAKGLSQEKSFDCKAAFPYVYLGSKYIMADREKDLNIYNFIH